MLYYTTDEGLGNSIFFFFKSKKSINIPTGVRAGR